MKRDLDLIRLILLRQEGNSPDLSAYSEEQRIYHSALLIDAGLVKGLAVYDKDGKLAMACSQHLTWKGHDFLDAARNETAWRRTLQMLKDKVVSAPFAVFEALLMKALKQQLGLEDADP